MLKVLQLIEDLEVGGAERLVLSLANRLSRDKFKPYVICLARPGALWEELAPDVERCVLHKKRAVDLAFLGALVREIKRIRPHVLHTHLFTANTWGRIAGVLAGRVPTVMTIHNIDSWKTSLHRACDHALAPFTSAFVAVSRRVCSHAVRFEGVRPMRARVIYNGIDVDLYDAVPTGGCRREFGISADEFLYGFVGRLVRQKGVEGLLRAFKKARNKIGHARLIIVGDGPERHNLIAFAENLGLEGAVIFARLRRDVPALLRDFDCFVLASRREGLPLALLEAMAAGVPVLATRVGGNTEVIESGVDGLLVDPASMDEFAAAMIAMAENKDLRERFARKGREKARKSFSEDNFIRSSQELYMELV